MNPTRSPHMPAEMKNAYVFAFFNAVCFQIFIGSPIILYAQSLGASATVVGVLMGLNPLFMILQMPAARYVERVGYKRSVVGGWFARTLLILIPIGLPFTEKIWDSATQLVILLMSMTLFCITRGISSCGWLPWITGLLPVEKRGHYMIREQSLIFISSLLTFLLTGFLLRHYTSTKIYSLLFAISFFGGMVSWYFLRRIPDLPLEEGIMTSRQPVPWKAIWSFKPFQKLTWLNLSWVLLTCAAGPYGVVYLRNTKAFDDGMILNLNALIFIGGLVGLWGIVTVTDRFGSRPVIIFAMIIHCFTLMGWLGLILGGLPMNYTVVASLWFLMGIGGSCFGVSFMRWLMNTVPVMGRSHFFALAQTLTNLAMALAPVLWGFVIDAGKTLQGGFLGSVGSVGYVIFFGISVLGMFLMFFQISEMVEEKERTLEELLYEIFLNAPLRTIQRLFGVLHIEE